MATFPIFQLPLSSTKLRFKEPFASQGLNLKLAGIIPVGIYRGFIPMPQPNFQLFINTNGNSNDSVAVIETVDNFSLTVRYIQQIVLDFTGQPLIDLPLLVVIRAAYSVNADPFGGSTDAKVLAVRPVLNNADPLSLHTGDIIICSVTGFGVGNVPIIDTSVANNNGGPLPTQQQTGPLAKLITDVGGLSTGSGVPVALPSSAFSFKLSKPSQVNFEVSLFQDRIDETFHDSFVTSTFSLQNMDTLAITDMWQNGVAHFDSGPSTYPTGIAAFGGVKRRILSLPAGTFNFQLMGRVAGPGTLTVTYPLSVLAFLIG